ncbi:MAG: DoxX family protein [Cocleimonas sp.]
MKKFLAGFLMGDCAPMDWLVKPFLLLGFRLYVAWVFFKAGLTKVGDNFMVTSSTIELFQYEYMPYVSESLASVGAYLATYAELVLPVMLAIGFFARPAALGLFILNAVAAYYIVSVADDYSAAGHWQHIAWGAMLAVIFAFGPGGLSIDKILSNKWKNG